MNKPLGIQIRGTGSWAPEEVLTNDFFSEYLDTSEEWILPRTGIRERRRLKPEESVLDLALNSSTRALQNAGMSADEIDLILVCTATPETPFPATACWLQDALGIAPRGAAAFDISAACSGFMYGLIVASSMIKAGTARNVLLVGAEALTRFTNYQDRSTCILFGDASGAAVLTPTDNPHQGVLYSELGADGSKAKAVWVPAGGARTPASAATVNESLHTMRMNGRELFKFAVLKMEELIDRTLEQTGLSPDDIKMVIPHQSNLRIIGSVRNRLNLPEEKVAVNIDRYGNTSSASIGLALDEGRRSGKLLPGDIVLLIAIGAGITWAVAVVRL